MATNPLQYVTNSYSYLTRSYSEGRRIGRYFRASWPWYISLSAYLALALAAGYYGYSYGMGGGWVITPYFVPLGVMGALAIWVMPEIRYPPVRQISKFLVAVIIAMGCWPDYIAFTTASLPWVTAMRLTGLPLLIILGICTFGSKPFRRRMGDLLRGEPWITILWIGFLAIALFSCLMSAEKGLSFARYFVVWYAWVSAYFASVWYFSKEGNVRRFSYILLGICILHIIIGTYEWRYRHLPWQGHIPSFLKIEDPAVNALLAGTARAAGGSYRLQSKFSTSIGLGEFFGLALPFILHLFFTTKRSAMKAFILFVIIPLMLFVVVQTDSRLAFISFLSSTLLYVLYQSVMVWRVNKHNIFAPAIMFSYPVFMTIFIVVSLTWRRLSNMIWGGGAAQFSTQARQDQIRLGMPMIWHNPLGYGIGMGARTLGYYAIGSTEPTVDSYFLTAGLEFGVIGFLVYYAIFGVALARAGFTALQAKSEDVMFLGAAFVALFNFVLSKSVYSQTENHPLSAILLGLVVALLRRYKTETGKLPPPPSEDDLLPPTTFDYVKDWERRHEWAK